MKLSSTVGAWLAATVVFSTASAEEFRFKEKFVAEIPGRVWEILKSYDPATGRFDGKVWDCRDQERMYPLAVAYVTPGQRCHKDRERLAVIVKAGDALIEAMDANGAWVYRKKDNSTWGMIRSPWVYSRWIMTFALICDDMPPERREAWRKALTLGYTAIARRELKQIHNISSFHAMGLYQAGLTLGRPEWCRQAADFLMKVVAAQSEEGYWKEGGGPLVVEYSFVYIEALGRPARRRPRTGARPDLRPGAVPPSHPADRSAEDRLSRGDVIRKQSPRMLFTRLQRLPQERASAR